VFGTILMIKNKLTTSIIFYMYYYEILRYCFSIPNTFQHF
jgi:hypothetical protein